MIKEFKLEDINPVADIINKVLQSVDTLRSYIRSSDYYVVLFLLSLQKDGLLNQLTKSNPKQVRNDLYTCFDRTEGKNNEVYKSILGIFEPLLNNISDIAIFELVNIYHSLNQEQLKEHFAEIFDDLLYKLFKAHGREAGEFIQPIEVSRFICGLAELQEKAKIYNPFAGLASFGVFMDGGQDYYGQEINSNTWALGALRIMAYERGGKSNYIQGDSIHNWLAEPNEFDLIIANPPYGMRLPRNIIGLFGNIRNSEQFLVEKGIESINETGKLIVAISHGFLFRSGDEQLLREYLIENDFLDMVISLPGGLLMNTGIPIVVLVINKNKKEHGVVRFIDAKQYVVDSSDRQKKLNDYSLNSVINSKKESDSLRIVSNNTIKDYGFNFNVPRYFQKEYYGVKLGDIGSFTRGHRVVEYQKGKFIRIRDLKDDKIDNRLDLNDIEDTDLPGHARKIEESCLLLAIRWKTLKPTFFEFTGTPIFVTPDIIAFKPDDTKVNTGYLINEFHSKQVREQAEAYRVGSTIPSIRRDDFLNIKIAIPSLQEQRAKISGLLELSDKIKFLQEERNALAHGQSTQQFSEFASLKHTLGRPRQNILDWADNLLDFFNKAEPDLLKTINHDFCDFYEIDIFQALGQIKRDINFISELLEKGEINGLNLDDYPKSLVSLAEVNKYLKGLTNNGFIFSLKKYLIEGEELKKQGIETNLMLLITLLENILSNADKHGFTKKEKSNEVILELTIVEDFLVIEIKNNGKPFPKNYSKEKFIAKYSTLDPNRGSGLGGYDINRIAKELGDADWMLILNENPIYPVKFKFQFPLKPIK